MYGYLAKSIDILRIEEFCNIHSHYLHASLSFLWIKPFLVMFSCRRYRVVHILYFKDDPSQYLFHSFFTGERYFKQNTSFFILLDKTWSKALVKMSENKNWKTVSDMAWMRSCLLYIYLCCLLYICLSSIVRETSIIYFVSKDKRLIQHIQMVV